MKTAMELLIDKLTKEKKEIELRAHGAVNDKQFYEQQANKYVSLIRLCESMLLIEQQQLEKAWDEATKQQTLRIQYGFWHEPNTFGKNETYLPDINNANIPHNSRGEEIDCHTAGNWAGHYGKPDFDTYFKTTYNE